MSCKGKRRRGDEQGCAVREAESALQWFVGTEILSQVQNFVF